MDYDLLIAGGGPVGMALAAMLAPKGWRIALIEARAAQVAPAGAGRHYALAAGTCHLLQSIGAWEALAAQAAPIHQVHVSEQGVPGRVQLDCREHGLGALGNVVASAQLEAALLATLGDRVRWLQPASIEALEQHREGLSVQLANDDRLLSAPLLVVAEGTRSRTRELLGLPSEHLDYGQFAIVCDVELAYPHRGVAYERFAPGGPIALLPLPAAQAMTVVCTVEAEQVSHWLALDEASFLTALSQRFGTRLGHFTAHGPRDAFPLQRMRVPQQSCGRAVLIGNAAHALHPIAGQGFNLGMRDAATLAERIHHARRMGIDWGEASVLDSYLQRRRRDQQMIMGFTHLLTQVFQPRLPPLALLRGAGLLALDLVPPLRRLLARRAMGL